MSITLDIPMAIEACSCGTVFAIPNWVIKFQCPMCADQKYSALQSRFDNVYTEKNRLERVVRGLRGALKQRRDR